MVYKLKFKVLPSNNVLVKKYMKKYEVLGVVGEGNF